MRLLGILKEHGDGSRGVYECDACHGFRFCKGIKMYEDEFFYENTLPSVSCYLCDARSPLSKRFSMALDTLAWSVRDRSGLVDGRECGFPSIERIVADNGIEDIEIDFRRNRHGYTAARHSCSFELPDSPNVSEPDEETRETMRRFVKEEVVSRVISDLHEQVKGAGHGTGRH